MDIKLLILTIIMCIATCTASAQERMINMGDSLPPIPYSEFVNANIVIVDIQTIDGEMPTCDYIYPPTNEEGVSLGWGKSIANATKVPGRMRITKGTDIIYDSGEYSEGRSGMTIRIRGNTSAFSSAKPYKINLQEKADLLMRNNPSYRDKDWNLILDVNHNWMMGLEVCRMLGMDWVPGYRYVTLILNDTYCGIRLLVESVKRNTNCRINISNNGFLFEYDAYWWAEDIYIPSSIYNTIAYTIKYPDPISDTDLQYLTQRIKNYETAFKNGTYENEIDVASFAKWVLGLDIMGIFDSAGSNMFLTLYDRNSKITIPTMWDFDSSKQRSTSWSRTHSNTMYRLFHSTNRLFVRTYVEEWESISPTIHARLSNVMGKYANSEEGTSLQRAYDFHNMIWTSHIPVKSSIVENLDWITIRKKWLDKNIQIYYTQGDVNHDWMVDISDVNSIINMILGFSEPNASSADINKDSIIDVEDVNSLINIILNAN